MKLQLSLLVACVAAKKRVTRQSDKPGKPPKHPNAPDYSDSGEKNLSLRSNVHCEDQPRGWKVSKVIHTLGNDDELWGSVSADNLHLRNMYCYIDFAGKCDEQGVDIEITKMDIESSVTDYYGPCDYDQVRFQYTDPDGNTQNTDHNCGWLNGPTQFLYQGYLWMNKPIKTPPQETHFSLVGDDMKLIVHTDSTAGYTTDGQIHFDWQCRSYGNDICPSKFIAGEVDSGCYTQSNLWRPGKDVSCSMDNAACLTTTCSADGISAFFREDVFHVNSKHPGSFMEQLQQGIRVLKRKDTGAVLVEDAPCGYKVVDGGAQVNWNYAGCGVAPTMTKTGKIAYGITIQALGNDADTDPMIEFYVDFDANAKCLFDPEIDIEADGFFVNQEDVDAETSEYGSLMKNFNCLFFEDANAKNQIKEHNLVNMGERIHGRVRSKNNGGYGLIYKLQRVTFTDASGKITPPPSFHVIGGGNGGQGSTVVKAAVQKSKYAPGKKYWRPLGQNMKFSFLSFGFENLSEQNEVDIKCRIRIDIDPVMFPDAAAANLNGEGTRTLDAPEYNYDDSADWGSLDYYDEDY